VRSALLLFPVFVWALAPAAQAEDEPQWRAAPRVLVGAGFDSNYAYSDTDAVRAGTAQAEAGFRLDWLPTLRTRVTMRHAYRQEGFVPLVKNTREQFGAGYDGALEWAYLTSLHTSLDAAAGGFTYRAPDIWGGRRSRGAYGNLGAQWTPGRTVLRAYGAGWYASDAVTAAALRDDTSIEGGLEVRYDPRPWFGLAAWGEGQRGTSSSREFRYAGAAGGGSVRLGLWHGAELAGWGELRRRSYLTARRDTRTAAGGALRQRLGEANRLALSAEWARNRSDVFAYERETAKLVWECEPAWLF
jgi:hypothetical protein